MCIRDSSNTMDELEVPTESRILFITPTLRASIDDLDTTQSRAVLSKFSSIIEVPQTRMYTAITLNDGTTNYGFKKSEGQYVKTKDTDVVKNKKYYTESGGIYSEVSSPTKSALNTYYELVGVGKNVNFLCVEKSAAVCAIDQYIKYFSPDQDQQGDSHVFKYRNNNLYAYCYENKLAGIYCSYVE
mgnify:FL=1